MKKEIGCSSSVVRSYNQHKLQILITMFIIIIIIIIIIIVIIIIIIIIIFELKELSLTCAL